MADFVTDINNKHIVRIQPNESLSALIKEKIKKQKKSSATPKNYYYLTDLCNPVQKFWSLKKPEIEKSDNLLRKLILGTQLGRFASVWFKKLPDFYLEEAILDGAWVNIPGVRGRIDFKVGDSIIEFKTKEKIPLTKDEIFEQYPNDLEQLLFYTVLHPSKPVINFLVFMDDSTPHTLRAYKVTITDFGRIKSLLMSRMKLLDEAIESDDYSRLGRCRYFGKKCQFEEQKVCNCENIEPLSTKTIKESIQIEFDKEFTEKLEEKRKEVLMPKHLFTTFNIIAPRQLYMEEVFHKKKEYRRNNQEEEYNACIGNVVRELPFIAKSSSIRQSLTEQLKDDRIQIGYRWIFLKSSIKDKDELIPYLVNASMTSHFPSTIKPSAYRVAELAIACATYGKTKGLIVIIFPEFDNLIKVFEVNFKDMDTVFIAVKDKMNFLEKSIEEKNMGELSECPNWMNKHNDCPMAEECKKLENNTCG